MIKPWFKIPDPIKEKAHIAVIGGGIAGVMLLYHLKKEGFQVTLFEKNDQILKGASGNPAAILDPYVSAGESLQKEFYNLAYSYALKFYRSLGNDIFKACPLIKYANDEKTLNRFRKVSENYPQDMVYLDNNKLVFPHGGYIIPENIRQSIDNTSDIKRKVNVKHMKLNNNDRWALYDHCDRLLLEADAVILASSYNCPEIAQTENIPLDKMAGQISYLKSDYDEDIVLNSAGYLTPPIKSNGAKFNICGASFEKNSSLEMSTKVHEENIKKAPYTFNKLEIIGGRRAIRAIPRDHLPLCGPAPDHDSYLSSYADIYHGNKYKIYPDAPLHKNLFITVGLGSKGFITAPILANYLTAIIGAKSLPFNENICHILHPARFIIREISKK